MADITRPPIQYSIYLVSQGPDQGSMTVGALLDFVKALVEAGIPDDAQVTAHHGYAGLLVRLSVRHTVTIDTDTNA